MNYETSIFAPTEDPLAVTVLLLPGSSMLSVASTLDPMRAANRLARRRLFDWRIVTLDGLPAALTCGLPVPADGRLDGLVHGNALFVIAGFNQERHAGKVALAALHAAARRFQAIGGVEAGSWLLARAGLLDGRAATTHWEDLEDFALQFPYVQVRPDRFVIDGRIFTTGGASPTFDLMLHLIRTRFGYPLALEVASVFIYEEAHASTDAQPLVSLGRLDGYEPRIARAIRMMEAHLEAPLTIAAIARRVGLSTRMLEILFKRTLGTGPGGYYLRLRLQAARRLVLDTRLSMQEIALRAGFGSLAAFSRTFRTHYTLSPRTYRRQHRPDGAGSQAG
jgi:AraC family transcriptional regulator, glycine betaine-responsive activator